MDNIKEGLMFAGRACRHSTPCKYWTYQPASRMCYLLKSCCVTVEDRARGFQSGPAGCPT